MYFIRTISLAVVLFGSLAVNSAPLPAVLPDQVKPGTVMMAKPMHFDPFHTQNSGHTGTISHPVIALSHPDENGRVPVVVVSHNHPKHMAVVKPHDAHLYHVHSKPGGHGEFQHGSKISVGHPVHVHIDDLHHVQPGTPPQDAATKTYMPSILHEKDIHKLKQAVHSASGQEFDHTAYSKSIPPWHAA